MKWRIFLILESKTCAFFGHRKIEITEELKQSVREKIEELILKHNVLIFLFGSRSDFDSLCHLIVTQLKQKYPEIKRIAYTCKNESCFLESEREKWEKTLSTLTKKEVHLNCFEEEFDHKTKYTAGRASYVERNQAMINDSDFCIFYYDEKRQPPQRNRNLYIVGSTKSGTKLAYEYAKQKKKVIYNMYLTSVK